MASNIENQLEDINETGQSLNPAINPLFDNPLKRFILSLEQVADAFGKSVLTIIRMANRGALPCHYAGETMMFHLDEVIEAFKSDKLALRRKCNANNKQNRSNQRPQMVRSTIKSSRTSLEQVLQQLPASFGLDQ